MVTLAQSNRYLREVRTRESMLADNARQSSLFEGANLAKARAVGQARGETRAAMASAKKRARSS
jgi:hypothetical protein